MNVCYAYISKIIAKHDVVSWHSAVKKNYIKKGCSDFYSSIPLNHSLEMASVKSNRNVILFWQKAHRFSQFHPARFVVEEIEYSCGEQYMMHQKAVVFGDKEMAQNILKETKPKKMKQFGRKVRNFDDAVWRIKSKEVVEKGNYEKFIQNEDMKEYLLSTGDDLLAEASPFDKRWGIGLGKNDKRALDPKQWKGKNWLGEALMNVRTKIRAECS